MVIDFRNLKDRVTLEQVLAWKGWSGTQKGDQLKGACLVCKDTSDRCFVVTLSKGLWHCFSCKAGGDCIELIALIEDCSTKKAAELIAAHFLTEQVDRVDELKPLDYLQPGHEAVTALMPKEVAEALGAGYAAKGTMAGRVLLPLRTPSGKLVGYVGVSNTLSPPLKTPSKWKL